MRRHLKPSIYLIILLGCAFTACKNEIDEYYARPDWLEPNIYDMLKEKGQFSSYLSVVDKAGYRDVLGRAGYFTVFAPTNEAFQQFIQEKSFASVEDIDTLTASKIVNYSVVYNAFTKENLDDYQSTAEQGWVLDKAFKRTTAYYKWVYDESVDGSLQKVIDQNGVPLLPESPPVFTPDDNNNKSIPYFTDPFMATKNITAYDYNYFFPGSEYSGFNVAGAKVTEADILCENGIVHAINRVILPLPNLDEQLSSNPDYSEFRNVIDNYIREFTLAPSSFLSRYEQVEGSRPNVYIKTYPLLNYAPNCENFMKYGGGEGYDAQIDGWTLFAPNNAAVLDFFNNKFLVYYKRLDNMPAQIIAEFVNAHLFRTTVWPSKFETTTNMFGEPARFDPEINITEKVFGSNGAFYGTDIIQKTDAFYTALGPIILNPDYSLMLQALYTSELFYVVKNTGIKLTVFMINNAEFDSLGLSYNIATGAWDLNDPDLGTNSSVAVNRLINMHVVLGEHPSFIDDALLETYGGEYIRQNYGFIWAAGNVEKAETLIPKNKTQASNGYTYTLTPAIRFSTENIGKHIQLKGADFSKFFSYLTKSASSLPGYVYDPSTMAIANIKNTENNTLLIPSNAAMDSAVAHGVLPAISPADFTQAQQDRLLKFVMYHTLAKLIVTNNGEISGDVKTLYSTPDGATYMTVFNDGANFGMIDHQGRTANVVLPASNVLSNRAVIHQIDNYLIY
jgi:uncharacterized surface protein with fasciclin (FAS1) repeats